MMMQAFCFCFLLLGHGLVAGFMLFQPIDIQYSPLLDPQSSSAARRRPTRRERGNRPGHSSRRNAAAVRLNDISNEDNVVQQNIQKGNKHNEFAETTDPEEQMQLHLPNGDVTIGNLSAVAKRPRHNKAPMTEEPPFTDHHVVDETKATKKKKKANRPQAYKHLYRYFTDICVDCWLSTMDAEGFLLSCNYTRSDIDEMQREFPRLLSLSVKMHLAPKVRFMVQTLGGGQGDICDGECPIDQDDSSFFVPHNCAISDEAKRAVPPAFFARRLERAIVPRHAYLVHYGLPHGRELLDKDGRLWREFLEASETPASQFASLCNRWSLKSKGTTPFTYKLLHTADMVEAFQDAMHRGLLPACRNEPSPELEGCSPGRMVQLLLQHGANAIEHDRLGNSMLHWAAGTGNLGGTEALLHHLVEAGEGADAAEIVLNTQASKDGATPLHWASSGVERGTFGVGGHVHICRLLLDEAGDRAAELANMECWSGTTPLMWAAWSGSLDVMKLLLSHGAEIHRKNDKGCSVVHWAAAGGDLQVCKYLRDKLGVNFHEESEKCHSPLYHAVSYGYHDVAEWLALQADRDWREEKGQISFAEADNGTFPNIV